MHSRDTPLVRHAAILAIVILLALGFHAFAADESRCGDTPTEATAAAEAALRSQTPEGQNRAIACLTQAVKQLSAAQPVAQRGDDHHSMLRVPAMTGGKGVTASKGGKR